MSSSSEEKTMTDHHGPPLAAMVLATFGGLLLFWLPLGAALLRWMWGRG